MCEFDHRGMRSPGAAGFVETLVAALVNSRIYSYGHPRVTTTIDELIERLDEHFAQRSEPYVLGMSEGFLMHDGRPLLASSMTAPRIVEALRRYDAGGIELRRGTTAEDVAGLLRVLADTKTSDQDHEQANARLAATAGDRIVLLPPYSEAGGESFAAGGDDDDLDGLEVPVQVYRRVVDVLQDMTVNICRESQFDLDPAREQIEAVLQSIDDEPATLMKLASYERYDAFTFGHSIRVCLLAIRFAQALTDDRQTVQRLGLAALLHDVGKARVPFEILQSRSRLSDEERREMNLHTTHGAHILLELDDCEPWAVTSALSHHRNASGVGYPSAPDCVPVSAATRLVTICDAYEALTAVRPYKAGMSPIRAFQIMLSMKGHFDPGLMRRFMQVMGFYPDGAQVLLSDGRKGTVQRQSARPDRPVVEVLYADDGSLLEDADREVLDLATQPADLRVQELQPA